MNKLERIEGLLLALEWLEVEFDAKASIALMMFQSILR